MESKQVEGEEQQPRRQEIDLETTIAQFAIKCATCELPNVRETKKSNKKSIKTTLVFYFVKPNNTSRV